MALYKRSTSPYWYSQFDYRGRTYVRSTKSTNRKLAKEIDKQIYNDVVEQYELGAFESITLEEAITSYLATVKHLRMRQNKKSELNRVMDHIHPMRELHKIRLKDVNRMLLEFDKADYKEGYKKMILAQLNLVLRHAKDIGYKSPQMELPKIKSRYKRIRYLTFDEERAILDRIDPKNCEYKPECQKYQLRQNEYDFAVLSLDLGTRRSELEGLIWRSVDFDTRTIRIFRPKVNNESILYMTQRVEQILQRRRQSMDDDEYYVFARSDKGNVIRLKVLQQAINDAGVNDHQIVELKGDRVTPHTFRKTFASRLVMNGVPIQEVSKMLGHSSIRMTEKSYAFLAPNAGTEKAAQLLDKLNKQNTAPVLTVVNQ